MARLKFNKTKVSDLNKSNENVEDLIDDQNAPVQQEAEPEEQVVPEHEVAEEHHEPVIEEHETHPETSEAEAKPEVHEEKKEEKPEKVQAESHEESHEGHERVEEEKHESDEVHGEEPPAYISEGDGFDAVYEGNEMPTDDFEDPRDIVNFEKARLRSDKEAMDMYLSQRLEDMESDFKNLPEEDKERLIKSLMEKDSNLGKILDKIHKGNENEGEDKEAGVTSESVEEYEKKIHDLQQKILALEAAKETREPEVKEEQGKSEDEIKPESHEEKKEETPEEKQENESDILDDKGESLAEKRTSANHGNDGIDVNSGDNQNVERTSERTPDRLSKVRVPERAQPQSQNNSQNVTQPGSPVFGVARKRDIPRGNRLGDVSSIQNSIARKNYNRTINDIKDCVNTTEAYNSDVYDYNNQVEHLGILDIVNNNSLTESQKNDKIREIYKENPGLSTLAKRIASNGKKIPYLHDKISDGLEESARLGMNVDDAAHTYNDLLNSSEHANKPLTSPPMIKLEEIARKIAEAVRKAIEKLSNVFVKKEARTPSPNDMR